MQIQKCGPMVTLNCKSRWKLLGNWRPPCITSTYPRSMLSTKGKKRLLMELPVKAWGSGKLPFTYTWTAWVWEISGWGLGIQDNYMLQMNRLSLRITGWRSRLQEIIWGEFWTLLVESYHFQVQPVPCCDLSVLFHDIEVYSMKPSK